MTGTDRRPHPDLNPDLCTGCGWCVDGCERGALALADDVAVFSRPDECAGCGTCVTTCPSEAVTLS